jgi:hypothetical protein
VRRGKGFCSGTIAGRKEDRNVGGLHPPAPYLDQDTDQRPDHLVTERGRGDVEAEQSTGRPDRIRTVRTPRTVWTSRTPRGPGNAKATTPKIRGFGPPGFEEATGDRLTDRMARRPATEGAEVVLAQQGVCGGAHRTDVEVMLDLPDESGYQRIRLVCDQDQVAVGTRRGGPPSIEPVGRRFDAPDDDGRCELPVHGPLQSDGICPGREVGVYDLSEGVYPGIGATGADEVDGVPAVIRDGPTELTGDGALTGLVGEAVEPGPVVGEDDPEPRRAYRPGPSSGIRPSFGFSPRFGIDRGPGVRINFGR